MQCNSGPPALFEQLFMVFMIIFFHFHGFYGNFLPEIYGFHVFWAQLNNILYSPCIFLQATKSHDPPLEHRWGLRPPSPPAERFGGNRRKLRTVKTPNGENSERRKLRKENTLSARAFAPLGVVRAFGPLVRAFARLLWPMPRLLGPLPCSLGPLHTLM